MASRLADLRAPHVPDGPQVHKSTSTQVDLSTSIQGHKSTSVPDEAQPRYQRRTYHVRPDQIDRIEAAAFQGKLDISEVVRRAIDAYLDGQQVHK